MKTAMKQATLALVLGLAALWTASNAQAAGTLAGTPITNTATLAYSVGMISQTAISADSIPFKVDRKINLTVTRTNGSIVIVSPGQATATINYSVTNQGNDAQDFALSSTPEGNGTADPFGGTITDNFDGTGMTVNVQGGGSNIINLAPDAVKNVTVTFAIPIGQVDKSVAVYCLMAVAKVANSAAATAVSQLVADTNGIWTVFADASGPDDVDRDATHSVRGAVIVSAPVLSIGKTALTIWDPANFNVTTPRSIPGAYVQYAIKIENAGTATSSASLTTISDTLNAVTPFDPDLMNNTLNTATPTPDIAAGRGFRVSHSAGRSMTGWPKYFSTANDADGVDLNVSTITANFATILPVESGYSAGELKPGESVTITYNVKIN